MKSRLSATPTSRVRVASGAALAGAAFTAAWVAVKARRAERQHPPRGKFVEVDGVQLHYVERGEGPPVVLVHGNTVSLEDFEASGLIERLARHRRVIAFDRPGYGHSARPHDRIFTLSAQAALLQAATAKLGAQQPVVLGHSMGALVALAWALDRPQSLRKLVLLSGYYYPRLRVDALLTAPVAIPVVGDVMRYTVTALVARATIKATAKAMFAPKDVPASFFPTLSREMMLRPVQLRANAEDAAFMMLTARGLAPNYLGLQLPVVIMAGSGDLIVDVDKHARRLHRELPESQLVLIPGTGHMLHYAVPERVVAAVEQNFPGQHGGLETFQR